MCQQRVHLVWFLLAVFLISKYILGVRDGMVFPVLVCRDVVSVSRRVFEFQHYTIIILFLGSSYPNSVYDMQQILQLAGVYSF